MNKLGLVGGVGYLATLEYYKNINEGFAKRITDAPQSGSNPPMVIESLNIADAYKLVEQKNWTEFIKLFANAIQAMHYAGANFDDLG